MAKGDTTAQSRVKFEYLRHEVYFIKFVVFFFFLLIYKLSNDISRISRISRYALMTKICICNSSKDLTVHATLPFTSFTRALHSLRSYNMIKCVKRGTK